MIWQRNTPNSLESHFVKYCIDPTGLGEPHFPPILAALANSLYKVIGKRVYEQPFHPQIDALDLGREVRPA